MLKEEAKLYIEGFNSEFSEDANPYSKGSKQHFYWHDGWEDAWADDSQYYHAAKKIIEEN